MIAHALDHGLRAAVSNRKPLARHAVEIGLAAGRPVQGHVADDDRLLRDKGRARKRDDHDPTAGHPLSKIIVRLALQRQRQPVDAPGPEALSGRSGKPEMDGILGKAFRAAAPCDLSG